MVNIGQFHDDMLARVRTDDGELCEWHAVTQGLRQGYVLSPLLRNVFLAAHRYIPFGSVSREDPNILRGLVHLDEDFGDGGLEVEPLACVRRSVCGTLYADDKGIAFKSIEDLAKITVTVIVLKSADLTVPETKTQTTLLRTPTKVLVATSLVVQAAGKRLYMQTMHFLYVGAVLSTQAPTICDKLIDGSDPRGNATIVSSWSCTIWKMLRSLAVRLIRTEVMNTLLYGRVARNLGQGHFDDL